MLIAFGLCVWFLVKDRNFWRNEYRTLACEARERERHLFDQLLKVKGFRTTSEPLTPQPTATRKPALDDEELTIMDERINEYIEAGVVRASEGHAWSNQLRDGNLTASQIDRMLMDRRRQEYQGSVADID